VAKKSHKVLEMLGNHGEFRGIVDFISKMGKLRACKTCRVKTEIYMSTFPVIVPLAGFR
jgi:hypothetical protein